MYQQLILVGNLGKDTDSKFTANGQNACTFPMATSKTFTGADGNPVTSVVWWRVTAWGKLAETCSKFLHKGSKVMVIGEIHADEKGQPRMWQDKEGFMHTSFEVTALKVIFMTPKADDTAAVEQPAESHEMPAGMDDSVPF